MPSIKLPDSVEEIAEVIGRERALYLIGRLPRSIQSSNQWVQIIMYVPKPKRMGIDHPLVKILGWDDAQKMAHAFGGETLHPAACSEIYRRFRDISIHRMAARGIKSTDIASQMDLTLRHVKNILGEKPHEEIANENNKDQPALQMRASASRNANHQPTK